MYKVFRSIIFLLLFVFASNELKAQEPQGNFYKVTLLRAAPGYFSSLLERIGGTDDQQIVMRHSQGDHWDVMILTELTDDNFPFTADYGLFVDYQHDFLATSSDTWEETLSLTSDAEIFHIEMFQAARGQEAALLKEREMENIYLEETGRKGNQIYETLFGSDVDNFTIGYYGSMIEFATDPDLSDEVYHQAATKAGFTSRSDIGFELRKYIVGHQDTIATKVK